MRISDWSSDVCSSDLRAWATRPPQKAPRPVTRTRLPMPLPEPDRLTVAQHVVERLLDQLTYPLRLVHYQAPRVPRPIGLHVEGDGVEHADADLRSEEHTSELQSLMRHSYAVFCL